MNNRFSVIFSQYSNEQLKQILAGNNYSAKAKETAREILYNRGVREEIHYSTYTNTQVTKQVFCIAGAAVGLLSVLSAIGSFAWWTGTYVSTLSYGGDAYTGIQNAAASTANNVQHLADVFKFTGGCILLVFGLFCIAFFLMNYFSISKVEVNTGNASINNMAAQSQNVDAKNFDANVQQAQTFIENNDKQSDNNAEVKDNETE